MPALAALAVALGLGAAAIAAWSTGAVEPLVFVADAGPLVRWSAPLVRVVLDLAAATTLGMFLLAATMLPDATTADRPDPGGHPDGVGRAVRIGTVAAGIWVVTALLGAVLTLADAIGLPLTSPDLPGQFAGLAWTIDATRIDLISALLAALVPVIAGFAPARRASWLAAATVAGLGIAILGLAGHTGTSDEHETAVSGLAVHLLGSTAWVGGLIAVLALRPGVTVVRRYSALALAGYVAVGASGVLTATTRLAAWWQLTTPYGRLILVKSAAFVLLGVAGWAHRRSSIAALGRGARAPFTRLAAGEVLVMAVTFGVATALARSAPPVPESFPDPTPALALTSFPAPAAPSLTGLVTTWRVDWLWLGFVVTALLGYAAGLVRRRRGPSGWPGRRTASWLAGLALATWLTSGLPAMLARVSYPWGLAVDLGLALVVAPLLVGGRPLVLAGSVLSARDDGTLGPREMLLGLRDGRLVRWLVSPGWTGPTAAAGGLVAVILVGHLSGANALTSTTYSGHLLARVVHLVAGIVLTIAVTAPATGIAPAPSGGIAAAPAASAGIAPARMGDVTRVVGVTQAAALPRLGALVGAAVLLGLVGVVLARSRVLVAPELYGALELAWVPDPLADQRCGAPVALVAAAWLLGWALLRWARDRRFHRGPPAARSPVPPSPPPG